MKTRFHQFLEIDSILFQMLKKNIYVVTLALSSQPRQALAKARAKKEARESHLMLSRM
jgi:hypothetical protein